MNCHLGDAGGDVDLLVVLRVADAVAAAQVQLRQDAAQLVPDLCQEGHHDVDGAEVYILAEDLGADVAVEAPQLEVRLGQRFADKFDGLTRLDGGAELGVDAAGVDGGVGVGVDARRYPQEDFLPDAGFSSLGVQGQQLFLVVHDEAADPLLHRIADVRIGLAVAVEVDVFRREAGGQGRVDFSGGDGVHTQSLLCRNAVELAERGCLGGIEDLGVFTEAAAEGIPVETAVLAEPRLVHQVQGSAVLLCQGHGVVAGEGQMTRLIPIDVSRKHFLHLSLHVFPGYPNTGSGRLQPFSRRF